MWQTVGQCVVFADTNQMWSGILWFLIIGGIFYWLMAQGGCGAHGHGGHGGHGDRSDRDRPQGGQADVSSRGSGEEPPSTSHRGEHHH